MNNKQKVTEFLGTKGGTIALTVAMYVVYFALDLLMLAVMSISENAFYVCLVVLIFPLSVAFAIEGWKALAMITPKIFLIMPIIGWVIYFTIKLMLAAFVGMFVAPYRWSKKISNRIASSEVN